MVQELTLKTVRKTKEDAEYAIEKILREFEQGTSVSIWDIEFSRKGMVKGYGPPPITKVNLVVRL